MKTHALVMVSMLLAAGCVTSPTPASQPQAISAVPTSGLSPQSLAVGECGLFLWSRTPPVRFVFFSKADSQTGKMLVGGEEAALRQTGAGGEIFGQFMTVQEYVLGDGVSRVNLAITPGEALEHGQRISEGRLVLTDAEGWETVLPVLGVRACQQK